MRDLLSAMYFASLAEVLKRRGLTNFGSGFGSGSARFDRNMGCGSRGSFAMFETRWFKVSIELN